MNYTLKTFFIKNYKEMIRDHLEFYTNSVFQVTAVGKEYDYSNPWDTPGFGKTWRGSSFAVNYKGNKTIVTNAHVSGDSSELSLRFSNDCKPYQAKVISIMHVCDLALLDVEDPEFWEKAVCLELGEMPDVQDEIKVVGFPQGGNEICVTSGKVNRIEMDKYEQGGVNLLQYQFDAAQTNGNSGGPVLFKDKIMGVAFQGLVDCDTTNYGIPLVVLEHFLEDSFYHDNKGFPDLNIKWQSMTNENLRKYFGMDPGDSGVIVSKIDPLSDLHPQVKVNDIILSVDGKDISNDGKVDLGRPLRNRIDFSYLVNMKYLGDTINIKVLRKAEIFDINIVLTKRHRETKKVGLREYDKPGQYYINSYLAFVPMSENFLEDALGELGSLLKSEKSKTDINDQHIVLSHIFPHKETYSYDKFDNSVVKEVNNKKFSNMTDLIKHLDEWEGKYVKVETKEGEIIVVPKLSHKENIRFLNKNFQIRYDRSDNFREEFSDEESTMEFGKEEMISALVRSIFGGDQDNGSSSEELSNESSISSYSEISSDESSETTLSNKRNRDFGSECSEIPLKRPCY